MSGGIDSTMAAVFLHEQGYEVIGMTMKTWDYASSGGSKKETGCCSLDSINDAREAAVHFGFPHYIIDIRPDFGEQVIQNFVDEYLAGRTPNPCILCNTHIKWEALLDKAKKMDCEFMATGHYAQLNQTNKRFHVSKGVDMAKDQSYVLWGLNQDVMAKTRFPLGSIVKTELRQMAKDMGFSALAEKNESYEICFVPDDDYRGFLKRKVPELESSVAGGNFVDSSGETIGTHNGYPFFTIGQRKGLGKAFGKPMFVTHIDPKTNTVMLGEEDELRKAAMMVGKINLQKFPEISEGMFARTMVRYQDPGAEAQLYSDKEGIKVEFSHLVKGIAPGQSAVFYDGDDLIGGGIIQRSIETNLN